MKRVTNTTLFIIIICYLSVICYKFHNYFINCILNIFLNKDNTKIRNIIYIILLSRKANSI